MDGLQLHLLTNHLPIIGTMAALLVVILGMLRKNDGAITAGLIIYVVMAVAVVPAYLSGEEAEERVENIAGVNESVIHEHEEMAELSLWLTSLSGLVALGAVVTRSKQSALAPKFTLAFVVLAIIAFGQAARTGHEGGKIRRPDLGTTVASPSHDEEDEH
ncbi:MAG: hypothetical protein ACK5BQ_09185 [Ignavibacteria bacterium]|jgi:hypothetical protein